MGQQIRLFREEHRNVVPRHRHCEKRAVRLDIACRNHKIAAARAFVPHLAPNVSRRVLALVKRRSRLVQPNAVRTLLWGTHRQQAFALERSQSRRSGHLAFAQFDALDRLVMMLCHSG